MDQETYLQQLGVTRWSLQTPASEKPDRNMINCYCYQVAESGLTLSVVDQASTQAQTLQEAILNAMKLTYKGGYIEQLDRSDCNRAKTILLMGHKTAEAYLKRAVNFTDEKGRWLMHQDQQVLITHGLDDLLQDKTLKKQAWVDVQLMMKAL